MFYLLIFIAVNLLYNVVLVSAVQKCVSAINILQSPASKASLSPSCPTPPI